MPEKARRGQARRFLLLNIIETYLHLTRPEEQRYNKELTRETNEEVKVMQLTWEEKHFYRGREEGITKGREQGVAKGWLEGSKATLIRQIEHRLGPLSEARRRSLESIEDSATIEDLATRLLDAASFADLGLEESG